MTNKKDTPLTKKQLRFIEAYGGNGTEAARIAGYQGGPDALGRAANRLLSDAKIAAAINAREIVESRGRIASRQQRQEFWTQIMEDVEARMQDRLKASEYLAKSEADFTTKVEHSGKVTLEDLVVGSLEEPK